MMVSQPFKTNWHKPTNTGCTIKMKTYTATVCKFRGGGTFFGLIYFRVWHSSAQSFLIRLVFPMQQIYIAFVELIHLNDLLNNVTSPLLTNKMPRKCDKTHI